MTRAWSFTRRHALDALVVAGALGAALEVALTDDADSGRSTGLGFAVPAAALLALPLLARRRRPFAAPVAVWLLAATVSFVDGRLVPSTAAVTAAGLAASFLLGQVRDAAQARLGLAIALAGAIVIVLNGPDPDAGDLVATPVLFLIAWLAGYALRERSAQARAAEERAAHAELQREAAARLAVAEERARIARELHDIVAHAVSVMVLQVGAIRHRLPASRDAEALREVEATGRTALAEMRRLLGAMRSDDEEPELAPQPGLASVDALLDGFRRAGLPVRLRVDGEAYPLPQALDLSAYRIIQEGLTNALKHAQAGRAEVVVRYGPGELRIDVRDDGVGPTAGDGLGHGLVGVRERVKIYGGEMTAGTANGGGFVLRTRLPVEGGRP